MSLPETVEIHKLTVREFHALEPVLDPDYRYELLDGQTYVLPIPQNWRTIALMERDGRFLRRERPGLRVWRGGLILKRRERILAGPDVAPC